MTKRTDAQKEAEKRYLAQNPMQSVRLPLDAVEELKQLASAQDQPYRGLLKQIILDWLDANRSPEKQ